jgi:hypothetical protein
MRVVECEAAVDLLALEPERRTGVEVENLK